MIFYLNIFLFCLGEQIDVRLVRTQLNTNKYQKRYYSFVESLTAEWDDEQRRDPSVAYFISNFKKKKAKVDLMRKIFDEVNELAFENRLPSDIELNWSERLRSTAGHCRTKITADGVYKSTIEISSKVCDTPGIIYKLISSFFLICLDSSI